jgi:hypothetical protein
VQYIVRSIMVASILWNGPNAAAEGSRKCTGDACAFIEIRSRDGCIIIANTGSQRIKWKPHELYLSYDAIEAHSEFKPLHGFPPEQHCTPSFSSDYEANFG